MTNEEILKKAIKKAEKNGFICIKEMPPIHIKKLLKDKLYFSVIFNKEFAKKFWPGEYTYEKEYYKNYQGSISLTEWKYHFQQMVLEKNPIKYLEKFL